MILVVITTRKCPAECGTSGHACTPIRVINRLRDSDVVLLYMICDVRLRALVRGRTNTQLI